MDHKNIFKSLFKISTVSRHSAVWTQRRVKSSQRPEQTSIQENKISQNVNKQPLVVIDLLCVHSETEKQS